MDEKLRAAIAVAAVVLEAIEAAGPAGVPDGHLYMMLQSTVGQQWTLSVHQTMIQALVDTGKIKNINHRLIAVNKLA